MKTLGRALLAFVLCVMLVGFGICGAYGTFGGLAFAFSGNTEGLVLFLPLGLLGFGIAWLAWKVLAGLWRKPPAPGP
jgi:tellurite resistance protein TehA-like permease